jgi:hypothetical protein
MKKIILIISLIVTGCQSSKNYPPAENALDAGREFVDACLKGEFKKADYYLLHNSQNDGLFTTLKATYNKETKEEKTELKNASINIQSIEELNDTVTIIHYSNSFSKISSILKTVKLNDTWLVDLAYAANGNL